MIKNRTFLLLAANVLLAVFIILNLDDEPSSIGNIDGNLSEMIANMNEITIRQPVRGQEIILKKNQMDWFLTQPVSWPVEPITLANLISKISHLEPTFICSVNELPSKGEIEQDYGFDTNSSSLQLSAGSKTLSFTLGDLTRDQSSRFLMIESSEGEGIWRAPRQIEDLLNRTTVDWTTLTFWNTPLYAIEALKVVEFKPDEQNIETAFTKLKESWEFSSPINGPANNEEVSLLLHKIVSRKLIGFSEIKDDQNLSKLFDISLQAMGKTHSLTLYQSPQGDVTELLALFSGKTQAFRVQASYAEIFQNLSTKLREKRLFSLEIDQVKRLRMVEGNRSLTLRKNDMNSWVGLEQNGTDSFTFQADLSVIVELIHNLNMVEVKDFILFSPDQSALHMHGFEHPQLKLEIEQMDTTRQNLLISKSNIESSLWNTYIAEQALICLVNTQWNKLISTRAINFKNRELLPDQFIPNRVVLNSITEKENLHIFSYEMDGEAYDRIMEFKADSFIELSYNDEGVWVEGDWLPWKYSVEFQNNAENSVNSILFNLTDRYGATKWFAGSPELGLVCNLPISVIDELSKGLSSKPLEP
jgi:hypothetical protein